MTGAGGEVYLNGAWVARDKAVVSAFDRGFIFGDGVYELVPAYDRKPFLADLHIARLARSLAAVSIANPLSTEQWIALIDEAAARQQFADQRIYLQVTRGAAPRLHRFPARAEPTVMLFADPLVLPGAAEVQQGAKAITAEDFRWMRGDIKSISLMAAVLYSERAAQAGATEAVLLRDGELTEGASSNIIIAERGKLLTPHLDRRVLPGVTLAHLRALAERAGTPIEFARITAAQLRGADEVMLCSSGKEVVAITTLDDAQVGSGTAGPLFGRLHRDLRASARGKLRASATA